MSENTDQQIPVKENKYIELMKKYKTLLFPFIVLAVLLVIIISIIVITAKKHPHNSVKTPTPTSIINISPSTVIQPTQNQNEAVTIKDQAKPQIDKLVNIDYTITKTSTYENDWAIVQISNPTTDPANVIMKRENGQWKVILGPGTFFDDVELQSVGAPTSLIKNANTN